MRAGQIEKQGGRLYTTHIMSVERHVKRTEKVVGGEGGIQSAPNRGEVKVNLRRTFGMSGVCYIDKVAYGMVIHRSQKVDDINTFLLFAHRIALSLKILTDLAPLCITMSLH